MDKLQTLFVMMMLSGGVVYSLCMTLVLYSILKRVGDLEEDAANQRWWMRELEDKLKRHGKALFRLIGTAPDAAAPRVPLEAYPDPEPWPAPSNSAGESRSTTPTHPRRP